nr:MAG TPA: hypothetical protein [Caudoviricetes sp.]
MPIYTRIIIYNFAKPAEKIYNSFTSKRSPLSIAHAIMVWVIFHE